MLRRASAAAATLGVALMLVTGCGGAPAPAESTASFSSEDEAFAAAEATYRAYVDAVNSNREDSTSQPDPQDFLIGSALEADLTAQQQLQAQGLRVVGPTVVRSTALLHADPNARRVELRACVDVSATAIHDADGADVTPVDRQTLFALEIQLTPADSGFAISESATSEDQSC